MKKFNAAGGIWTRDLGYWNALESNNLTTEPKNQFSILLRESSSILFKLTTFDFRFFSFSLQRKTTPVLKTNTVFSSSVPFLVLTWHSVALHHSTVPYICNSPTLRSTACRVTNKIHMKTWQVNYFCNGNQMGKFYFSTTSSDVYSSRTSCNSFLNSLKVSHEIKLQTIFDLTIDRFYHNRMMHFIQYLLFFKWKLLKVVNFNPKFLNLLNIAFEQVLKPDLKTFLLKLDSLWLWKIEMKTNWKVSVFLCEDILVCGGRFPWTTWTARQILHRILHRFSASHWYVPPHLPSLFSPLNTNERWSLVC